MKLKILAWLYFLIISLSSYSQQKTSLECLNRVFHVKVRIIGDSANVLPVDPVQLNSIFNNINKQWAKICVSFVLCEVVIDSNHNFTFWKESIHEKEYLALNHESRIITIYVVHRIVEPSYIYEYATTLGGISSRGQPYIIVETDRFEDWIHEMGHFFGLKNTFDIPLALADNSDCSSTKDDGLCDTPPDPDVLGSLRSGCVYNGNLKDTNGKYYNPLTENFMSNYGNCRRSFTHAQYEKMIKTYKLDPQAHF